MKNHKMYVALGGKGCLIERCHICQNADLGKCTIDLDTNADDCMLPLHQEMCRRYLVAEMPQQ